MPDLAMLDYFYGDEAEQFTFYRIPKVLFTDPSYRRISSDAKILYGLLVSVIRSRNISAHIVLQTFSQLKGMYKDNAETVAGCCSTMLFLGGKEESSLKMVSGLLGKETIDTMNESDSRGAQRTYGLNYQKLGKELMSVDELAVMPSSRCIVQVQGVRPFYSKKYDLTKHPQYKYTADANPKFAFDVKAYLQHRLKVKPEEEFEVYDLGEIEQPQAAA